MGKRKNLISRATTLLDSNVQFLTTKKIKHTNKQESMTHSNEKKKLKINRNCPWKRPDDRYTKDFKMTSL